MAAPFYNLLSKCDRALVAYITSEGAGTASDVFPQKRSEGKTLPVTICWSHSAKPLDGNPWSGVYEIQATVYVRTFGIGEDFENINQVPAANSDARVALTFDAFHSHIPDQAGNSLGDAITEAARHSSVSPRDGDLSDFTCQSCEVLEMDAQFEAKGDAWVDAIHLLLVCTASDTLQAV